MIAREFPGQFPAEKLLNLDVRDEEFWAIEARKREMRREISLLQAVRFGIHAKPSDYEERLARLNFELNKYEEEQ